MERLSKKSIFSYALGDLASQLVWTFVGMYLSVYYLDVVGLAPAAASAIMLIAKVWDAVNDPMMGAICERTKSKY
jgi:Na+/melibiose symporter-like transporter